MQKSGVVVLLRVAAAVLAVAALGLTGLRLYALSGQEISGAEALVHSLRLLFPFTLGLLFGYLAIRGRFPFDLRAGERDRDGSRR